VREEQVASLSCENHTKLRVFVRSRKVIEAEIPNWHLQLSFKKKKNEKKVAQHDAKQGKKKERETAKKSEQLKKAVIIPKNTIFSPTFTSIP